MSGASTGAAGRLFGLSVLSRRVAHALMRARHRALPERGLKAASTPRREHWGTGRARFKALAAARLARFGGVVETG